LALKSYDAEKRQGRLQAAYGETVGHYADWAQVNAQEIRTANDLHSFALQPGRTVSSPASTSLIGDLFPGTRRARAIAIWMLGLSIGAAVMRVLSRITVFTGGRNVAVGTNALVNQTTGINNIALGLNAGGSVTTGDNNIHVGAVGFLTDSGVIRIGIGGTHTRSFIAGIRGVTTGVNDAMAVLIDSDGQLGTTSSSRRVKTDIHDLADQSRALHQLRPVSFRYRIHPPGPLEYGLIAEEVAEIYPELVVLDKDGQPSGVRYHVLPAMLLNELQRQRRDSEARFAAQQREIDELRAQVWALIDGRKAAARE
jgi:hypothetical protein